MNVCPSFEIISPNPVEEKKNEKKSVSMGGDRGGKKFFLKLISIYPLK